jgi:hypothetical protein
MKYLRFYLDRECVVVPGWGKTKRVRSGCDRWTLTDTQRNLDMLKSNAKAVNGTGGLLIVDVDPKNGGSLGALRQRFPDLPGTRAIQTVTPHPSGFGTHLLYTIPDDVRVAHRQLGAGIDIPHAVMLPGSVVLCDDGVERTYELVHDVEPAAAPLGLIAAVDKGQDSGMDAEVDLNSFDADEITQSLVDKFANAGPGERNAVFLQVAPAVIRLRGTAGADMLRWAYSGDDDRWLELALKSAMEKYAGAAAPNTVLPSRYARQAQRRAALTARYGPWSGRTGATERKVLLAVLRRCETRAQMTTVASVRTLALEAGLEPKTVTSAIKKLLDSGRLYVVSHGDDGVREYAPVVWGSTTPPLEGLSGLAIREPATSVGESTAVVGKGKSPLRGFPVDPLHDVWLGDGLTGRHSHVFDLVDGGACRAKQIATAGGMGFDTARDALKVLVDSGMLDKQGTVYSVPGDVVEKANRLAVDRGGVQKRAMLADRIRDERARPRGDAAPATSDGVSEVDGDDIDAELRRWHEEELMRQLGLI